VTLRAVRVAGIACVSAVLCLGRDCASAAGDRETSRSFEVTIESQLDMTVQGAKQKIQADTGIRYTLVRRGREVTVVFDEVRVKATNNGAELMNTTMSADKFVTVNQGKVQEVRAADAPEELKKLLADSFGVPLCRILLDADGKETKRTIVAGPGAKSLLDNGLIAGARLFHVAFPPKDRRWEASSEVSMGNGGYARGVLTYEKTEALKPGQTPAKVSGTLTCERFSPPNSPVAVKDARYAVKGTQTYDSAAGEWTSGDLSLEISFDLEADGKPTGSAKGVMQLKLKSLSKPGPR